MWTKPERNVVEVCGMRNYAERAQPWGVILLSDESMPVRMSFTLLSTDSIIKIDLHNISSSLATWEAHSFLKGV